MEFIALLYLFIIGWKLDGIHDELKKLNKKHNNEEAKN